MPTTAFPRRARTAHTQGGFSVLEVLIAASLLAIALLGHTASVFSEHRLSSAERARSTALMAAEQFMERLRSDDDWTTLYSRLLVLDQLALKPGGTVFLEDNRRAFPPQAYYDDFVTPSGLNSLHVLVAVPSAPAAGATAGEIALREDVPLAQFALPSDLDGDGVMDDQPHDGDYRILPVVVYVRWTADGAAPVELRVSSWLWGSR